jgi:HME family heavy-metal exporter
VAVVIFGGLVSSTLLDTLLTPLLFWLLGEKPLQRLVGKPAHLLPAEGEAEEAY